MSRRLRVVQVAGFPVLPALAGGKIRIVKLARALCALGVDVTVIAPYHVTQTRALAEQEPFELLEVRYPFVIPYLLTDRPLPYGALVSYHPGYQAMLPRRLDSFDLCQLEHPAFVDLVRGLPGRQPVVYDAQNVEYDYVRAECRREAVRRFAGDRVRALEAELMARADHVFACSAHDLGRLGELYGEPRAGSVIPNGIDPVAAEAAPASATPCAPPPRVPKRAIFSGSAVAHNHEAAQALLTRVAPALKDEVEFVIVGACARRFRGCELPNVVLDPDGHVSAYAEATTIGLNPVLQGSGTSLKLLDYLAHGMPVLSTRFGMRGFEELTPWVEIAELDAFADALRGAVRTPEGVGDKLPAYQWDVIAKEALRVYEGLVQ